MEFELITLVMIGTDWIDSYKSNYHTITTTTAPIKERYVQTQRHTIQVDYIEYMDELAELNGCLPNLRK
jgi:dimethylaniline monooxygenase (N-oxide forming)